MNQYHFDINSIPPRAAPIDCMDGVIARQFQMIAAARERQLRELAKPYLAAGYIASELTAVERAPDWLRPERMYVCVKVEKNRSRLRLWVRRRMRELGFFRQPYVEGCVWRR